MDKKDLKRMWGIFLAENETTTKDVAEQLGIFPQALGRKINNGSIKYLELVNIFEKYGYQFSLKKN